MRGLYKHTVGSSYSEGGGNTRIFTVFSLRVFTRFQVDNEEKRKNTEVPAFWRLELQVIPHLNMLVIEAFRELKRDEKRRRTVRRMKKMYKLPNDFDISTLETKVSPSGVYIQARRRKQRIVLPPSFRRQCAC